MLQRGRINFVSQNKSNEINYIIVPKGFLSSMDIDKAASKMFSALNLPLPEMIFQVPESETFEETFIHDAENALTKSWYKVYHELLKPLMDAEHEKNPEIVEEFLWLCNTDSVENLEWSRHTMALAIWLLRKHLNSDLQINPNQTTYSDNSDTSVIGNRESRESRESRDSDVTPPRTPSAATPASASSNLSPNMFASPSPSLFPSAHTEMRGTPLASFSSMFSRVTAHRTQNSNSWTILIGV